MVERFLRSRKFLTLVMDAVVSLVIYFVTKYLAPAVADDVLFVIATLQPVVLAVIVMWGVEDAAEKRAGVPSGWPHGVDEVYEPVHLSDEERRRTLEKAGVLRD